MVIEWNDEAVNGLLTGWVNGQADRLADIARRNGSDDASFETVHATPFVVSASVVGDTKSLRAEYGDAFTDPAPWGWPAITQAAIDG